MNRPEILRTATFATAVTLLALLYFFFDARHSGFFPACPFYTMTGNFCPGCGSQRAISAMLHGDLNEAIKHNLLLVLMAPLVLCSAGRNLLNTFKKRAEPSIFYSPSFVRLLLVGVILFGILRNIPTYPFTKLTP